MLGSKMCVVICFSAAMSATRGAQLDTQLPACLPMWPGWNTSGNSFRDLFSLQRGHAEQDQWILLGHLGRCDHSWLRFRTHFYAAIGPWQSCPET